jgi:hypothetical protein
MGFLEVRKGQLNFHKIELCFHDAENDLSVIDGLMQAAIGDPWMPDGTHIRYLGK